MMLPGAPAPARGTDGQPVQEQKCSGTDPEHHGGMAVDAGIQASAPGLREVFAHGQRVDVAEPAVIEVAGPRMVDRMGALPVVYGVNVTRRKVLPTRSPPSDGRTSRDRNRAEDKQPYEKARSRHRENES